jgi:hypothetical protein
MPRHLRRERPLALRIVRFVWRCLRVLLMAFAAIGPLPPLPPPPRPDVIELRQERLPKARKRR